jgi:phytoene/squalene synthetase
VLEDLQRERVYLPTTWLHGAEPRDILDGHSPSEPAIVEAVRRLLAFADERYSRGLSSLHYLAPQSRFAIRVAARCYAAIGARVIRDGCLARERSIVPLSQKILLACQMGLASKLKNSMPQESN